MMGCALLCPGLCLFQHLEPTRTRWRDDHTGTMTKAEDNKEEDTATGTDRPQGCCECKFHAFSPTKIKKKKNQKFKKSKKFFGWQDSNCFCFVYFFLLFFHLFSFLFGGVAFHPLHVVSPVLLTEHLSQHCFHH